MNGLSRRALIQRSIFSASLLAVEGVRTGKLALARGPTNPALTGGSFKLGTVTYNLAKSWDTPTIIKNCEETGFEAVELRTSHAHGVEPALNKDQRREVMQRFANSKVRLLSLGSTCEYHSPVPSTVRRNIEETKRFIELAHDVGAIGVKVRPNGVPKEVPEEQTLTQIGTALRECGETGAGFGVEIWVEVHGERSSVPWRMRRMLEVADHPQVGICWNSNKEDVENGSVKNAFELLKPFLRNIHINELWRKDYPWRELFSLVRESQYNRYCLAEIPEAQDPIRLMRYYKALWEALSS